MNIGDIFSILLIFPITNLLVGFYVLLNTIGIPFALGFSIILLTILTRLILLPFIAAQIKSAHKMQKVAPHVANLREKHKDDRKRQQEELMKLYKEHEINPAAGCLPLIIQIPVIWSLYHVLSDVVSEKSAETIAQINEIVYFDFLRIQNMWNTHFFGINLTAAPSRNLADAPYLILVPVITGVLQFVLSKMMMPEEPVKTNKDDFQTTFQKQSVYIFPLMIGVFSFTLPVGLSLYWNTFTIFGILQQYYLIGWGGMKPLIQKVRNNG